MPLYDAGTRLASLKQAEGECRDRRSCPYQNAEREAVRQIVLADNALHTIPFLIYGVDSAELGDAGNVRCGSDCLSQRRGDRSQTPRSRKPQIASGQQRTRRRLQQRRCRRRRHWPLPSARSATAALILSLSNLRRWCRDGRRIPIRSVGFSRIRGWWVDIRFDDLAQPAFASKNQHARP